MQTEDFRKIIGSALPTQAGLRFLTVAALLLPTSLSAQDSQQGTITGFVYDQLQAVVPRAQVTVISQSTALARAGASDEKGVYTVVALQPGVYTVKAAAAGFKTIEQTGVIVDVGASVRVNFHMELGAVTDTVIVRDVAPVLKAETGEVSSLVSGAQLTELALNGRNFTQLLTLGTGVVSQQTGHQMGLGQEGNPLMVVHGGRISMNKYTFDGTLAMDTAGNRGLDLFPPMEAIEEVKVQKSNYGADAGGYGYGIVNIVTRAGGQRFHSDAYEYFRNDKLDARNFFSNQRQAIRFNNFGYTFGGPFYIPGHYNTEKSKDFFFFSETWARRVGPQIDTFTAPPLGVFTGAVATAAMRAGDFSGLAPIHEASSGQPYPNNRIPSSQFDPNAVLLVNTFYLLPNRPGPVNFVYNTRSFTPYREELLRWDHQFSSRFTWTNRYAQDTWYQNQDVHRPGPSIFPTFQNVMGKPGKNLTSKLTTVVNPSVVNLVTFGYSYNQFSNVPSTGQRPSGLNIPEAYSSNPFNLIPDVTLAQGYAGIGQGSPQQNWNPLYTFKDDLSITHGRHELKVGAEIVRHLYRTINYLNEQGVFNFNGSATGNAFADFLVGRAFTYTENDKDPGVEVTGWDNEFYVQDNFKVSSKLTLNLGVRWALIRGGNGGAAVDNNISTFVPSLYKPSQAPRLLSDGQIVAGTGNPLNGIITPLDLKGLDLPPSMMRPNNDVFCPRFGFAYSPDSKTVLRGGFGINAFWGTAGNFGRRANPPFTNSVNVQSTLLSNPLGGQGRTFPPNVTSLDIYSKQPTVESWSFTIQRELMTGASVEIGYVGTRGVHLPRTVQLNQADPLVPGNANLRRPYLGYGTLAYNENSADSKYHGLEASFIRRFSHGLMVEASYTWSKALGHPETTPLDSRNKNLDFGLLDLDRTHMLSFNYVWELPFYKSSKGLASGILGGWQLSGFTSFQSGLPLNVTQAGDVANFGGGTGAQRPDIVGDPGQGRGQSLFRYFNVAAFRQVTKTGQIGTSPYNPVRGPGVNNFDISLLKNIRPREGMRLQLGLEAFNAFNHSQFEGVGGDITSPTFGVVTSARDPRVVQARAKVSF